MGNNIFFLTLRIFSATGGIEKVCKIAGKAIYETGISTGAGVKIFSMYDKQQDADNNKYFPSKIFRGFGIQKIKFILAALKEARKTKIVLLSHINLLVVGWLIKKRFPRVKLMILAHGIEVWSPLSRRKRMMLQYCDRIISVSKFTSDKIQKLHGIPASRCTIINNCLDPYLPAAKNAQIQNTNLRKKYGYSEDDNILFTLSRLSSEERYKGYDKVLESIVQLRYEHPEICYLLAGAYDLKEKEYVDKMISDLELKEHVTVTGFIPEEEIVAHFQMSDIYIMPSTSEGFGIVFIEAMYYGLPVIAGNIDGSVDALCNGKLGILVNPVDVNAISSAIKKILENKASFIPDRAFLLEHFSYKVYKNKFEKLLMAAG